ncbi:hypothetical protein GIB67_002065 [Kingdonia uniflora]|uniref:Uncharacterized protein n=1 Tax=Kingdonia uniflora TaxID=39325 RepID=A0A7J7KWM9_9MAGN|nr:hypothetical protein GIB67_002065 [Kingdonia uniflora]
MELLFRTVKQTLKSQVARKDSLLDTISQEETKLEVVLEDLGISWKKRANSRVEKVQKSQSTRLMKSTDDSKMKGTDGKRKQMLKRPSTSRTTRSGEAVKKRSVEPSKRLGMEVIEDRPVVEDDLKEVEEKARSAAFHGDEKMSKIAVRLMKVICLGVEEERAELKRKKVELERNVARFKNDLLKEGKWVEALKASQVVEINSLHVEARTNLEEVVAERDRLGRHLVSKEYFEDEVDVIRSNTYVEEEEDEEIEDVAAGIDNGLDGVSPQTVRDNQGDDNERPEGENEKKILDVEELNREIKVLHAQVADLEAINQAESAKADKKLEENIAFTD